MTSLVSRVACMRLLGGVQPALKPARGATSHPPHGLLGAPLPFAIPPPNAAHHPPRSPMAEHNMPRVRGRVHALVMRRARHVVTRPRRNHVASTRPECLPYALRRDRRITPGITRRPKPLKVYDKQRVGGRVHAVVSPPADYERPFKRISPAAVSRKPHRS